MKIYAPNKQANGVYASVMFVNGVGETDNPKLIEWFKTHGYKLEKCDETAQIPLEKCESLRVEKLPTAPERELEMLENGDQPDFDNMTPNELRQWAIERGLGSKIRNTRNKEKLLEILRG